MYRRPMSPNNSRVATYLQALQRDETINSLRRQYAHHRTVEAEYDDLKYEISKAERQNKKLEEKNIQIQQEYMEKIRCNKGLITQLGAQIEQVQSKIKTTSDSGAQKQAHNESIIQDIKQTKVKINDCQEDNKRLEQQIQGQDTVINSLTKTIEQLMIKKKQSQDQNKNHSQAIDLQFEQYKTLQERAKSEQLLNSQLREELNILKSKKTKLHSKVDHVQQKIKDLKKKLEQAEQEKQKLSHRCHEAEKQSSKLYGQATTLKQNIENCLNKNKDHTTKLKTVEVILKENVNSLSVKQTTKEKMSVEWSDLTKDIEKAEAIIRSLDKQTEEQQANNKGLITNLKKSIQSDEQAVKALTRKAAILNLISQS